MVREVRSKCDMTQTDLGHVLGVTRRSVSDWENGRAAVPKAAAIVMRGILGGYVAAAAPDVACWIGPGAVTKGKERKGK